MVERTADREIPQTRIEALTGESIATWGRRIERRAETILKDVDFTTIRPQSVGLVDTRAYPNPDGHSLVTMSWTNGYSLLRYERQLLQRNRLSEDFLIFGRYGAHSITARISKVRGLFENLSFEKDGMPALTLADIRDITKQLGLTPQRRARKAA